VLRCLAETLCHPSAHATGVKLTVGNLEDLRKAYKGAQDPDPDSESPGLVASADDDVLCCLPVALLLLRCVWSVVIFQPGQLRCLHLLKFGSFALRLIPTLRLLPSLCPG
jgi:hypothetical protein